MDSTIEDLYADGAYQSPDNREFAKNHNAMQLKTGKICKVDADGNWYHDDEDGLTVREIATGNTYEQESQSRHKAGPESDGESHGTTKPVGVTLKTKTLKPIS